MSTVYLLKDDYVNNSLDMFRAPRGYGNRQSHDPWLANQNYIYPPTPKPSQKIPHKPSETINILVVYRLLLYQTKYEVKTNCCNFPQSVLLRHLSKRPPFLIYVHPRNHNLTKTYKPNVDIHEYHINWWVMHSCAWLRITHLQCASLYIHNYKSKWTYEP